MFSWEHRSTVLSREPAVVLVILLWGTMGWQWSLPTASSHWRPSAEERSHVIVTWGSLLVVSLFTGCEASHCTHNLCWMIEFGRLHGLFFCQLRLPVCWATSADRTCNVREVVRLCCATFEVPHLEHYVWFQDPGPAGGEHKLKRKYQRDWVA